MSTEPTLPDCPFCHFPGRRKAITAAGVAYEYECGTTRTITKQGPRTERSGECYEAEVIR